jgi:DNA polymerase-1
LRSGLRGFAVDAEAAANLEVRLGVEQERLEQQLAALGIAAIATEAGRASIVDALESEGVELANGKLDRSVLGPIAAAGSVVARAVLELRTTTKLRSLYSKMFERALAQDGRLHAYTRSLAATTGRMAISGHAPLQTAPNVIELGEHARFAVRDVLVADDGNVVASVDFAGMELRIAAGLSGDANLRSVVESGDPHTAVARQLFNTAAPTPKQRATAKTVNFATMYGQQAHSLSLRLGVSHVQAQRLIDSWWARFPALQRYAVACSDEDRTPWGRRLPVDVPKHAKLNHRIQAAGRDVFCAGLLRLEDAGLVDRLALPLHDEYVMTVPEANARELVAAIAAHVRSQIGDVPLPVEANVGGRSWGSAK